MPALNLPTQVRALLQHFAQSNDPLAIVCKAVLDAEESEPGATGFGTSATELHDDTQLPGTATLVSRGDHRHPHGNRGGGTLHAAVIAGGANGFMSGTDKTKLDGVAAAAAALTSTAPVDPSTTAADVGDGTTAARHNHKHHIAEATGSVAGLESAADKTKLDSLPANIDPLITGKELQFSTAAGKVATLTFDNYGRLTAYTETPP